MINAELGWQSSRNSISRRSRSGSSTDLTAPKFDFRFTPESGLKSDISPCPFRANNGLMHRSKKSLFDHFVGAGEQHGRHGDAELLCRLEIDYQLELGGLFDRQVGWLCTLENLVDEARSTAI
jgi:hypothetical protein